MPWTFSPSEDVLDGCDSVGLGYQPSLSLSQIWVYHKVVMRKNSVFGKIVFFHTVSAKHFVVHLFSVKGMNKICF